MALSFQLLVPPPRRRTCMSISSSPAAAVTFAAPGSLQDSSATLQAKKVMLHPPLAPRHIECWYLWQTAGLSTKQIAERLNLREGIIFYYLTVCIKNGCRLQFYDISVFYRILQRCTVQKDLVLGKRVHALAVENGYESNTFLASNIIRMYASLGRVDEATQVFTKVAAPDIFVWVSIVKAHADHERPGHAIRLYRQMRESSVKANNYMFVAVLKACTAAMDLACGKEVHVDFLESEVELSDVFVGNCLVDMYAKCGSLVDAHGVFDKLSTRNVVTWNSMIAGYVQHGLGHEALSLFASMQQYGLIPDRVTFMSLLQACACVRNLYQGRKLHTQIQEGGLERDVVIGSCLINMYGKCGSLDDARSVFDRLLSKNVVTWTAMIAAYAEQGLDEAFSLYITMQAEGIAPNRVTFSCLLRACASIGSLHKGEQLHSHIQERGLESDVVIGNSLVDMYAKCGDLEAARKVFDNLAKRDVVTWNSMFAGYVQQELGNEAICLYACLQRTGMPSPNHVTFVSLLQACAISGDLHLGKQLHAQIRERKMEALLVVSNCLVDMYAKCGSLGDARMVFDSLLNKDVVTWTAMMAGYVQHGSSDEVLTLYGSMRQDSISPNHVTFACLLRACAIAGALDQGKQLHVQIQERGLENVEIVGTCLVDMYAKCGSLVKARAVFNKLPSKGVMTWNCLIAGYVHHELSHEALSLYSSMQQDSMTSANQVTFVCLLQACTRAGALGQGKELHAQIQERRLEGDVCIGPSLVDMYAKCGSLGDARKVLDSMPARGVVAWTALLNGYAQHGYGPMAMQCFEEMQKEGVEPNSATFLCLFVACSREGRVNDGLQYFKVMVEDYGIKPTAYHYCCMVDLLGRSGKLNEAESVLQAMPLKNVVGWTSLLSSCKSHGDLDRGRRCFNHLITCEPGNGAAYVLLASMYANAGRWMDAHKIELMRKQAGAKKKPAKACIEVRHKVLEFTVGQDRDDLSSRLRSMTWMLKDEGGHVPHAELVLKELSVGEKEDALCGHAEKLALAYGLLNTPGGTPLLVTKNLRMCSDCHSGTKIMSRLEKRKIIVRDAHCVHHFVDGSCSCADRY